MRVIGGLGGGLVPRGVGTADRGHAVRRSDRGGERRDRFFAGLRFRLRCVVASTAGTAWFAFPARLAGFARSITRAAKIGFAIVAFAPRAGAFALRAGLIGGGF